MAWRSKEVGASTAFGGSARTWQAAIHSNPRKTRREQQRMAISPPGNTAQQEGSLPTFLQAVGVLLHRVHGRSCKLLQGPFFVLTIIRFAKHEMLSIYGECFFFARIVARQLQLLMPRK